jgi:hypothetical protein
VLARSSAEERAVAIFNLAGGDGEVHVEGASRTLGRVLDSSEERFGGPGARSPGELLAGRVTDVGLRPRSFALYTGRAA